MTGCTFTGNLKQDLRMKKMTEFDKSKTCKDCPDRSVVPNCHNDCEGYLERCKKQRAIAEKEKQYSDFERYRFDAIERVKKQKNRRKGKG